MFYFRLLAVPLGDRILGVRRSSFAAGALPTTIAAERTVQMTELDFIINYDIKYRMGDELNAGE